LLVAFLVRRPDRLVATLAAMPYPSIAISIRVTLARTVCIESVGLCRGHSRLSVTEVTELRQQTLDA